MAPGLLGLAVMPAATSAGRGGCVGAERLVSGQGMVRFSTGHVQGGELSGRAYHGQATLSSNRRILLVSLSLPLVQLAHAVVVGGAKAVVPSAAAQAQETQGPGEEPPLEVFGFDGLGKASEDYVPGKIVALAQAGDGAVLFLGVDGFELPLQLVVGPAEAMAVLTAVQERKTRRPVTHEAWGLSLAAVGWTVDRVAITSNESDVFYSRVILSNPSAKMKSIDVRPSDGIALALRCRAPLFVCRKVARDILLGTNLDQAGKIQLDPLKRPSLQANNKSMYVDNVLVPTIPDNVSEPLLVMDEDISELLGTNVKIFL